MDVFRLSDQMNNPMQNATGGGGGGNQMMSGGPMPNQMQINNNPGVMNQNQMPVS